MAGRVVVEGLDALAVAGGQVELVLGDVDADEQGLVGGR